jgi:hypothetical protein
MAKQWTYQTPTTLPISIYTALPTTAKRNYSGMTIKDFRAVKHSPTKVLLTWYTDPYYLKSQYHIYRKYTEATQPVEIASGSGYSFTDDITGIYDEHITYIVEVMGGTATATIYRIGDDYLLGMAGSYLWQLQYAGNSTKCVAYCKARTSEDCPDCYNAILKKRKWLECATCNNTGRLDAYKGPIPMYISVLRKSEEEQNIGNIIRKYEILSAWTGNIPILNIGDIIITNDQKKYIIQTIPVYKEMHSAEHNDIFIAKQDITLRRLGNDEYEDLVWTE